MRPRTFRSILRAVPALLLAGLVACGDDDPAEPVPPDLVGTWNRVNSTFPELDSMRVQVDAAESRGTVTFVPANPFLFQAGDVKWAGITETATRQYDFDDLVRQQTSGDTSRVAGVMTLSADGDSLGMTFPTTATVQLWVRVN